MKRFIHSPTQLPDKKYRCINTFCFVLACFILLILIGIDWKMLQTIIFSASIAIDQYDSEVSFYAIAAWAIVLSFVLFFLFFCVFGARANEDLWIKHVFLAIILIFVFVPKEAIIMKYITCFNFYHKIFVQVRVYLTFVFISLLALTLLLDIFGLRKERSSLIIIPLVLVLISALVMNSLILESLQTDFNKDINKHTIKFGIFTSDEYEQIRNGTYIKDSTYDERIIGSLDALFNSQDNEIHGEICSNIECTNQYIRYYRFDIDCNSTSLFDDCKNASRIAFKLKYIEENHEIPTFSCAVVTENEWCTQGCQVFQQQYSIYLVQEFMHKVELPWLGLGKCQVKQPHVNISYLRDSNLCI
jgi:hypothetical protein